MEETTKPLRPTARAMHDDSRAISKLKPKIKIVHVFAPKIIETEPAKFQEIVQRLTGKPRKRAGSKDKETSVGVEDKGITMAKGLRSGEGVRREVKEDEKLWLENSGGFFGGMGSGEGVRREFKEEEEEELSMETSGGFFGGMGEAEGFFQGFNDFPFLPLSSSHVEVMGKPHAS